jgi:hypothetical protein
MAVQGTINSITLQPDGTGSGMIYQVIVTFADSTTGFNQNKTYNFPTNVTIATARAAIQSDLNSLKALEAQATSLQQYVGTVLT